MAACAGEHERSALEGGEALNSGERGKPRRDRLESKDGSGRTVVPQVRGARHKCLTAHIDAPFFLVECRITT
jgi:hypothetical protein